MCLPEIETARLTLRLARPGMEGAMARFLAENFAGHLDRWSPPPTPAFFTDAFWAERLAIAVEEFAGRPRGALRAAGKGPRRRADRRAPANYTNIVRGAFHACHLGYQIARSA